MSGFEALVYKIHHYPLMQQQQKQQEFAVAAAARATRVRI